MAVGQPRTPNIDNASGGNGNHVHKYDVRRRGNDENATAVAAASSALLKDLDVVKQAVAPAQA